MTGIELRDRAPNAAERTAPSQVPDAVIELMVQASLNDAFRQKGLSADGTLHFDASGQSYSFMGVDLKQTMRAAIAAIGKDGWAIARLGK